MKKQCMLVAVVVSWCLGASMAASAGDRIFFTTNRDGNGEIYAMNPDGSGQVNLTRSSANEYNPRPGPSKNLISFERVANGARNVWVMDLAGGNQRQITTLSAPATIWGHSWSPDGSQLVAGIDPTGTWNRGQSEIWILSATGQPLRRLTSNARDDKEPRWSPDGQWIVFARCQWVNWTFSADLYKIRPDGSGLTQLTKDSPPYPSSTEDLFPVWRPDSAVIAWRRGIPNTNIWTMNADGSGKAIAIPGGEHPSYFSTGDRMAYVVRKTSGDHEIWAAQVNGTNPRRLVSTPGFANFAPCCVSLAWILASGTPQPGATITFALSSPGDAGLPYQVASSFGTGPIKIGMRSLKLTFDPLFVASVTGLLPGIFQGYSGLMNSQARGQAKLQIPNSPVVHGLRIYTAFLTLDAAAPAGIRDISNSAVVAIP